MELFIYREISIVILFAYSLNIAVFEKNVSQVYIILYLTLPDVILTIKPYSDPKYLVLFENCCLKSDHVFGAAPYPKDT
jgi:hypothetical protein